jgi:RNA polymerase sigma-70 factor, ECF subfamily
MFQEESDSESSIVNTPAQFGNWLESNRSHLLAILQQKVSQKLQSKVDFDDILQDSASRALSSLGGLNLAEREVMPWFLQIVNHTIVDIYRHHFGSQKRDADRERSANQNLSSDPDQQGQLAELLVASITSPSKAFSQHIRMDRMQAALNQLAPDARQAIHWRYMEGLSSQEIATRLQKTDGAVRVLLTRTLKKLEELLNDVRPS